jgi:hypothetical protein
MTLIASCFGRLNYDNSSVDEAKTSGLMAIKGQLAKSPITIYKNPITGMPVIAGGEDVLAEITRRLSPDYRQGSFISPLVFLDKNAPDADLGKAFDVFA